MKIYRVEDFSGVGPYHSPMFNLFIFAGMYPENIWQDKELNPAPLKDDSIDWDSFPYSSSFLFGCDSRKQLYNWFYQWFVKYDKINLFDSICGMDIFDIVEYQVLDSNRLIAGKHQVCFDPKGVCKETTYKFAELKNWA